MAEVDVVTGSIASGQSVSGEIDVGTKGIVGLRLPSNWTAAAGGISFQSSVDGGVTWYEVAVAGAAYVLDYTAAGGAYLAIDPSALRGIVSLKIRSGLVGAPVNQTNSVTLTLVTRLVH